MSEQNQESKVFTQEDVIKGLKEAIEIQTLQTQLQELRTRMVTAKANEIHATIQINGMIREQEDDIPEEELEKEIEQKERKLKVPEAKI